ncbi:MAG: cytidine deaminase [Syntrophomonadaceae bacterium]|nr:cytidine deaminase [Syntrophomonadaceae bacterium]
MTDHELLTIALEARDRAYAPYSGFKVGAALLDLDGHVYEGCNVENASYGLTICAERAAVVKAISAGSRRFDKILIVDGEEIITPCGACRQVLYEFAPHLKVICADSSGKMIEYDLENLLPHSFSLQQRED